MMTSILKISIKFGLLLTTLLYLNSCSKDNNISLEHDNSIDFFTSSIEDSPAAMYYNDDLSVFVFGKQHDNCFNKITGINYMHEHNDTLTHLIITDNKLDFIYFSSNNNKIDLIINIEYLDEKVWCSISKYNWTNGENEIKSIAFSESNTLKAGKYVQNEFIGNIQTVIAILKSLKTYEQEITSYVENLEAISSVLQWNSENANVSELDEIPTNTPRSPVYFSGNEVNPQKKISLNFNNNIEFNAVMVSENIIEITSIGTGEPPFLYYTEATGLQESNKFSGNFSYGKKYLFAILDSKNNISIINKTFFKVIEDIEGNLYKTVKIGDQWWMAENLRVRQYSDGTSIPHIQDDKDWSNLENNDVDKAYCWYENDSAEFSRTYGVLYTFAAATNGANANLLGENDMIQGACPDGWHLPSDEEWKVLTDFIENNCNGLSVGAVLKAKSGWNDDGNGSDDFGFAALPGGGRFYGSFRGSEKSGYWWSSTEYNGGRYIYNRILFNDNNEIGSWDFDKSYGASIRCIKN